MVEEAGLPLAGAQVYLVARDPVPESPGPVRAVTTLDGRFQFSAKDLTYLAPDGLPARRPALMIATLEGYGPDWAATWGHVAIPTMPLDGIPAEKSTERTLTLPRDLPIRGRLLGPDGRPIADSRVSLDGLHRPWGKIGDDVLARAASSGNLFGLEGRDALWGRPKVLSLGGEVVTDADGRFSLGGLGRDRLARLNFRTPGFVDASIEVMTREMPTHRRRLEGSPADYVLHGAAFTIGLESGRDLTGVVVDRETGSPIADVRVRATAGNRWDDLAQVSDARGRFSIPGLSPDARGRGVVAIPAPGQPYLMANAAVDESGHAVERCPRGLPYRLALKDRAGRPVEAEVTCWPIMPNPHFLEWVEATEGQLNSTISKAARQADGSYRGVAMAGPGVITAKTAAGSGCRPANVDPKAFFAPGRDGWTAQDLISAYGNRDTLAIANSSGRTWIVQDDYAAIIPIDPPKGSGPLELSATVEPDRPRQVTLVDPEGRPVVGVTTQGLTSYPNDREPVLSGSSFPLTGLHPDRGRRITFLEEDRKLIGFLLARGDCDSPYTVRMEPWATATGRTVDAEGSPMGCGPDG